MWIAKWLSMTFGQVWHPVWVHQNGDRFSAYTLDPNKTQPIFATDLIRPRDPNRTDQGDKP